MSIFEQNDYRIFLKNHIKKLPKAGRGELGKIANHLGINQTLLSQILSGTREFTMDQTYNLSQYLGLTELESEYFSLLVQKERAATNKYKTHLQSRLEKIKKDSLELSNRIPHEKTLSDIEQAKFYSSWLYSAVRLFTSINDGQTLEQICERFNLTRIKANLLLRFLVECGLVIQEGEIFKLGIQRTHLDRQSNFIEKHHTNWRLKALQRCENLTVEEVMFSGPFSIGRKDFNMLRDKIVELVKHVSETAKESTPEDVACFNVDFFWVK
jgi:uncharacterized protein (TIGR02147 family)